MTASAAAIFLCTAFIGAQAPATPPQTPAPAAGQGAAIEGELADAVSALVNLGYRRVEAFSAVTNASRKLGGKAAVGDLIRAGLQELGTPA